MYSQAPYPTTASPYTSPPPPPVDPYRASPIPVSSRQPYTFSPPPQPMPPMPPGTTSAAYMRSPPAGAGYGYPQQQQAPRSRYPGPGYSNGQANAGGGAGGVPQGQPPPQRHKGTLAPGQIVKVGEQAVRIEKYLSEGGYAHVYLTTSEQPIYPPSKKDSGSKGRWGEKGYTQHCLKRIAFQDESVWADVRKEIEVMKALPPNPHLTQYLGSAHTKLPRGGYEVYILMEFCSGGGIIDLLNKRLRDRLKEIEILNIFTDVCEAVAAMHFLRQPLLHRDLKIENVLSSPNGQPPTPQRPTPLTFKLCDFGSTTFPAMQPPSTKLEAEALALDLNKHTTLQYRSPEMVEPMLGLAVGLPSDVWALGVLLYKLCYYTTPFEEHGTLAIVNAKYTFPQYPLYSPKLQHLIASMLVEQPVRRPSVFEVLKIAHEMSGTRPEIDYPTPSRSFASPPAQQSRTAIKSSSTNLLDFTSPSSSIDRAPVMQPSLASTVQPQRRGRPTAHRAGSSTQGQSPQTQPSMPVPPSIAHQQPTPSPVTGAKLQVTGDKPPSPEKTGSVDAFGMPSLSANRGTKPQTGSTTSGFGDSFAASAASKPQPKPGFTDSFSGRQGSSLSVSPTKSGVRQSSPSTQSSFSAFDMPRTTSPAAVTTARRSPDPASSIPDGEVSFETRFPSIETMDSGDAYSSTTLSTATAKPEAARSNLISPITSHPPLNGRKPSIMGNLTGGDIANKNQHLPAAGPGGPQPRSTHVTGTAFKQAQGGMLSPDPGPNTISTSSLNSSFGASAPKQDYFDGVEARPLVSRSGSHTSAQSPGLAPQTPNVVPPDLMTGDDTTLGGALLRPTASRTPSNIGNMPRPPSANSSVSAATAVSASQPPATGHSRPLLPHIDSKKPDSNIDSENWSPLERLKTNASTSSIRQEGETKKPQTWRQQTSSSARSSSDEEGPESAERRRPSRSGSTGIANRRSMFERRPDDNTSTTSVGGGTASGYKPPSPVKSPRPLGTSPTKGSAMVGQAGGYGTATSAPALGGRSDSNGRGQPVSMYNMPPSASRSTISTSSTARLSPPPSAGMAPSASIAPTASHASSTALPVPSDRPRHVRKGSINDIVSKYESLTSPASGPFTAKPSKPSVAAKPAGLRKPTTDAPAISGAGPMSPTASSPVKAGRKSLEKPAKPSKPDLIRPVAVRHGEAPPVAQWSKTSSGRSFPVVPNKPGLTNSMSGLNIAGEDEPAGDASNARANAVPASGKSSPEKQQPVNMLIQRWNQGKVGEERKAPRKGEGFI